jgi:hypothetical protein
MPRSEGRWAPAPIEAEIEAVSRVRRAAFEYAVSGTGVSYCPIGDSEVDERCRRMLATLVRLADVIVEEREDVEDRVWLILGEHDSTDVSMRLDSNFRTSVREIWSDMAVDHWARSIEMHGGFDCCTRFLLKTLTRDARDALAETLCDCVWVAPDVRGVNAWLRELGQFEYHFGQCWKPRHAKRAAKASLDMCEKIAGFDGDMDELAAIVEAMPTGWRYSGWANDMCAAIKASSLGRLPGAEPQRTLPLLSLPPCRLSSGGSPQ